MKFRGIELNNGDVIDIYSKKGRLISTVTLYGHDKMLYWKIIAEHEITEIAETHKIIKH